MRRNWIARLAVVAVLLASAPAFAQSDAEAFKKAYKQGMTHYEKGNYEEAARDFEEALQHREHAVLLYNLAKSYTYIGEWEKVVEYAVRAEESSGDLDPSTGAKNGATGVAAGAVLSAREYAPAIADAGTSEPGDSSETEGAEEPKAARDSSSTDRSASAGETTDTGSAGGGGFGGLGWAGVGGAAAGVGLLGGALLVDVGLADDFEALDQARSDGDTQRFSNVRNRIEGQQQTGRILLYSGAGLASVGATLLVLELTGSESSSSASSHLRASPTRLRVAPARGGGLLQLDMAF